MTPRSTVALLAGAVLGVACRAPTEVRLELSTDAECGDVTGTTITTGLLIELEDRPPTTATTHCDPRSGRIGSVVVVPARKKDDEFAVRIVTGFFKEPEQCVADDFAGGCIVARRALSFIPHETIELPIVMEAACIDIPCGATETCRAGRCVSATLADPRRCTDPAGCDDVAGGTGGALSGSGGVGDNPSSGGEGVTGGASSGTAGMGARPAVGGAAGSARGGAAGATAGPPGAGRGGASAGTGGEDAVVLGGAAGIAGAGGRGGRGGAPAGTGGQSAAGAPPGGTSGAGGAGTGGAGGGSVLRPSCEGMTGTECQGEDCCWSIFVPGGTFEMGRSESGTDADALGDADEQPEHPAVVSSFHLDAFEVTVGRFRRFVSLYDGTPPTAGEGEHPLIPGSGWQSQWNSSLAPSQAGLLGAVGCGTNQQTWTDTPNSNETYPANCVDWYTAFAFCVWDGARLPTEAEWEFAAAGGDENRLYPWGSQPLDATLANSVDSANSARTDVGSYPAGQGFWGHRDLGGSLWEWVLDGYSSTWYSNGDCGDCAQLGDVAARVVRGGSYANNGPLLRAAGRLSFAPENGSTARGFRCAISP